MFNSRSNEPLDKLLSDAQGIMFEREEFLAGVQKTETKIAECEQELQAARERIAAEEFQAAQKEGGLAIASKAAEQALAEAELKIKSARLRLRGLLGQRERIEARLVAAWDRLEAHRDDFIRQKVAELRAQFDAMIEAVLGWLWRLHALLPYAGAQQGEKYGCRPSGDHLICLFNPIGTGNGLVIKDGMFVRFHGKDGTIWKTWQQDAEASKLNEAIRTMNERISPIEAIAKQIRPNKE